MKSPLRIIVTGLIAMYPLGGVAWDYLQYVIGLARLGHDVFYYEDTWSWPYDPIKKKNSDDGNYSANYIRAFFRQYAPNLNSHWLYVHLNEEWYGMDRAEFDEVARTADLFLNVSGACTFPEKLSPNCIKVFLDTDPGYNQIILSERPLWSENVERWCKRVNAHDRHFTYAENIHGADCLIPKMDFEWKTTRMPIVLDLWEPFFRKNQPSQAPWTTVMSWNAFRGKLIYNGMEYQSKGKEFSKIIGLPKCTGVPFRIAVGGVTTPFKWLERHGFQMTSKLLSTLERYRKFRRLSRYGWQVVDGPEATLTPTQYQEFIDSSYAEVSIAKHVYVAMRTGWFSCRSACYLATGRPVVVQDTAFSCAIPVGKGIFSFKNDYEAADAINEVVTNYIQHSKAARVIADEYFDSDKVLMHLIDDAFSR